jgi:hypothetical protein
MRLRPVPGDRSQGLSDRIEEEEPLFVGKLGPGKGPRTRLNIGYESCQWGRCVP